MLWEFEGIYERMSKPMTKKANDRKIMLTTSLGASTILAVIVKLHCIDVQVETAFHPFLSIKL